MKKILIIICLLLITGCFEDSGVINKSCTKVEKINTLNSNIKYDFSFKKDKLQDLKITYDYEDSNKDTIKSIRLSLRTQNNYLKLNNTVTNDLENRYTVTYQIPIEEEILKKFNANISRTEMVKNLKEQGYICN